MVSSTSCAVIGAFVSGERIDKIGCYLTLSVSHKMLDHQPESSNTDVLDLLIRNT